MAYDEQLATRIRESVASGADTFTERKMFGGLGFMVNGHMAVAASGEGGIMVRADPATSHALVTTTDAELMEMRGRPMAGWLRIGAAHLVEDEDLDRWVQTGLDYVDTLPPKN